MTLKIRCNDKVIVLTGDDKGKVGNVKKILSNNKVIVFGINLKKKHQKSIPSINQIGGLIKKELPIDISNIAIFNFYTKKPDRVGFKFNGIKKIRFFKFNGKIIN